MAPEIKRQGRSFSAARRRTGKVCELDVPPLGMGRGAVPGGESLFGGNQDVFGVQSQAGQNSCSHFLSAARTCRGESTRLLPTTTLQ